MEYLKKSDLGQWTLQKSKSSTPHELINHVLDNPQDTSAPRVLSDYYLDQDRHPGKLIGDSRAGDEPIKNMHPDLKHLHDWEGLHPAVRPLLHHTNDSTREERLARHHKLADQLIRKHVPSLLELNPSLARHANTLRSLPPLNSPESYKKAQEVLSDATDAANATANDVNREYYLPIGEEDYDSQRERHNHMHEDHKMDEGQSGIRALTDHLADTWNHGHSAVNHDAPLHENYFSDQEGAPFKQVTSLAGRLGSGALHTANMRHNMLSAYNSYNRLPEPPDHISPTIDKLKHNTNKTLVNVLAGSKS